MILLQIRHNDAIIKLSQKQRAAIMILAAPPLFYGFCSIAGNLRSKADGHVAYIRSDMQHSHIHPQSRSPWGCACGAPVSGGIHDRTPDIDAHD